MTEDSAGPQRRYYRPPYGPKVLWEDRHNVVHPAVWAQPIADEPKPVTQRGVNLTDSPPVADALRSRQQTPEALLLNHGVRLKSYAPGRHYTTCPKCSRDRKTAAHRNDPVLGVTIEADEKVHFGCNHCGWTGPEKGKGAGRDDPPPDHPYRDANGELRAGKMRNRHGKKPRFIFKYWDGSTWISAKENNKRETRITIPLIYRADEVKQAIDDGREIACVEGEKDVDNLWRIGFAATCNAHGASEQGKKPKWSIAHSEQLRGADIVVLNDNDDPGYLHAQATCLLSIGVAKRVRRLDLKEHWPLIPEGGDVSDWLAQGHTGEELEALIADAPDFEPTDRKIEGTEQTTKVAGVEKRIVSFAELNHRFGLLETPGAASVYISRADSLPIQENDLKRRLAGEVVPTGVKEDRQPIYTSAYTYWTGHARRHRYRRIAFANHGVPPDTLNLFKGFGVTPRAGRCDRILAHIREVICANDEAAAAAMLKLMAWQIQNIGKPGRVIVVLKTRKHQAGKGVLLSETLLKIYGDEAGFIPSSTEQVAGRFNDALVGRAYIFMDEVMFGGDRRSADAIKSLATATTYGIERKGLPIIQCPVGVNLWLATNHDTAAFIEEADTRYWVLDVSESRIGDTSYFAALMEEIENGGREAFAHYLLNLDVVGFVPLRDVPKNNAAKREMIRRSINPYDARKWLEDCCVTRQLIGHVRPRYRTPYDDDLPWPRTSGDSQNETDTWAEWVAGDEYPFHVLANAYTRWQRDVKSPVRSDPTPVGSLGEALSKAGFEKGRSKTSRNRVLPDPDECLKRLYDDTPGDTHGDSL
jgi:hypothetical protein